VRRIPYRLGLLIVALILMAFSGSRHSPAQDALDVGQVLTRVYAGYGGYALPVANSALARQWAADGGLAWQVGMNYSTIPVFIDILHRQPMARRVRVAVTSEFGYALEEMQQAGAGTGATAPRSPAVSVTREVLVPPSVPVSISLLPRTCPPSRPGNIQRLAVKVEIEGQQQPLIYSPEVIQLEPAHLYSLYLDGPAGDFYRDYVNQDNHLDLQIPIATDEAQQQVLAELLATRLYTMGIDHHEMTLAPLAARDFAFVVASLEQVRAWPEEDQQALLAFMVSGGRLCLFNADGRWQGLNLTADALPVGRGYLLPVAGDFAAARQAIVGWLEGELSELTLWCRGSVGGWQSEVLSHEADLGEQLDLAALFGLADQSGVVTSHRPGFMHPLWIYREACFLGALEPWTYPEFTTADTHVVTNNVNLSTLENDSDAPAARETRPTNLLPFRLYVGEVRKWPVALGWIALALPLVVLFGGLRPRIRALLPIIALATLTGSVAAWWLAKPLQPPPLHALLLDVDQALPLAVIRELTAARVSPRAETGLALAAGSFVRRVSWNPVGPWTVESTDHRWRWRGIGRDNTVSLLTETYADSPRLPVSVASRRVDDSNLELTIDTSGLPARDECYLLTPLGWIVVPGNQPRYKVHLELPPITERPGLQRIRAWEARLEAWLPAQRRFGSLMQGRNNSLLRHLNQITQSAGDADRAASSGSTAIPHASAAQLAWMGLAQNPTAERGLIHHQGVLFAPLDPTAVVAGEAGQTMAFLRLTFNLEGQR